MTWFLGRRWAKARRKSAPKRGLSHSLGVEPLEGRQLLTISVITPPAAPAVSDNIYRPVVIDGGEQFIIGTQFSVTSSWNHGREDRVAGVQTFMNPKSDLRNVPDKAFFLRKLNAATSAFEPVPVKVSVCRSNGWITLTESQTDLLEPGGTGTYIVGYSVKEAGLVGTTETMILKRVNVRQTRGHRNLERVRYDFAPPLRHLIGAPTQLDVVQEDLGATATAAPGRKNVELMAFTTYVHAEFGNPVRLENSVFEIRIHGAANVVNSVFSVWGDEDGDGDPDSKLVGGLRPVGDDLTAHINSVVWGRETFFLMADQIVANPTGTLSATFDLDTGNFISARESGKSNPRALVGMKVDGIGITGANIVVTTAETTVFNFDGGQPPPTVTLSLAGSPMAEAGGVATVRATLSNVSGQNVTVDLGFSGTATLAADYTRSSSEIVIPAGSLNGSLTLTAVQDTLVETSETIAVDITGVTNGTESGMQQVVAVITDDPTPQPSASLFVLPDSTVPEPLKHLAGTEERIMSFRLRAVGGAVTVDDLFITTVLGLGESSLKFFRDGSTVAFATANVATGAVPTSYFSRSARTFLAHGSSGLFTLADGQESLIVVVGVFLPDTQGGISGEPVFPVLVSSAFDGSGQASVRAHDSNGVLHPNNGDFVDQGGEIFFAAAPGPNADLVGQEQVIVTAEIQSVVANPTGTAFAPGVNQLLGSFTYTAAMHDNTLNGREDVVFRQFAFLVFSTNVNLSNIRVANAANPGLSVPGFVTVLAPGLLQVTTPNINLSGIDVTIAAGQSETFIVTADYGKADLSLTSTLQVAASSGGAELWSTVDTLTNRWFAGEDRPDIFSQLKTG
ncbi:hypothetical protein A3A67_02625 [Candidatus Peribacteria bacterium RIFCSPLOWO2_01_FULL_51_18]|nr:MAG: hypothetical protein A3A67_02625 [Candidatus Peribacteria bacterium RIFCSPLOWO2_01_FULL_51_18]